MIKLQNIVKTYGKGSNAFTALHGIDLTIADGEFVAIMGSSGSGKSTLMNIIGALDSSTSGTYELDGVEVSKIKDRNLAELRNRMFGFIFQRYNLLHQMTVEDNVALPGKYGNVKNLKKKVQEKIDLVGLKGKEKNKANELSGGQMQRVSVARALLMNPKVILADEPTGNLDSVTGTEIMELVTELHKMGSTVILITHEEYIAHYADRILLLEDGLIKSDIKDEKEVK